MKKPNKGQLLNIIVVILIIGTAAQGYYRDRLLTRYGILSKTESLVKRKVKGGYSYRYTFLTKEGWSREGSVGTRKWVHRNVNIHPDSTYFIIYVPSKPHINTLIHRRKFNESKLFHKPTEHCWWWLDV